MFKDLFKHEELYECCGEYFGFGMITMLRDFGPLKKGEQYDSAWFQVEESVLEIYDSSEHKLVDINCKLEAIL